MRIGTTEGPWLDLRIAGYEFGRLSGTITAVLPLVDSTDSDANWLVIEGVASDGEKTWRFRDPSLLTWDVERLAGWFDAVATDRPVEAIDFTEPNLTFEHLDSHIRVRFELEARPPWRPQEIDDWGTAWIDVAADPDDLRRAASDLRADLARFPPRGVRQG